MSTSAGTSTAAPTSATGKAPIATSASSATRPPAKAIRKASRSATGSCGRSVEKSATRATDSPGAAAYDPRRPAWPGRRHRAGPRRTGCRTVRPGSARRSVGSRCVRRSRANTTDTRRARQGWRGRAGGGGQPARVVMTDGPWRASAAGASIGSTDRTGRPVEGGWPCMSSSRSRADTVPRGASPNGSRETLAAAGLDSEVRRRASVKDVAGMTRSWSGARRTWGTGSRTPNRFVEHHRTRPGNGTRSGCSAAARSAPNRVGREGARPEGRRRADGHRGARRDVHARDHQVFFGAFDPNDAPVGVFEQVLSHMPAA